MENQHDRTDPAFRRTVRINTLESAEQEAQIAAHLRDGAHRIVSGAVMGFSVAVPGLSDGGDVLPFFWLDEADAPAQEALARLRAIPDGTDTRWTWDVSGPGGDRPIDNTCLARLSLSSPGPTGRVVAAFWFPAAHYKLLGHVVSARCLAILARKPGLQRLLDEIIRDYVISFDAGDMTPLAVFVAACRP